MLARNRKRNQAHKRAMKQAQREASWGRISEDKVPGRIKSLTRRYLSK
jgi:hypothetical protein